MIERDIMSRQYYRILSLLAALILTLSVQHRSGSR